MFKVIAVMLCAAPVPRDGPTPDTLKAITRAVPKGWTVTATGKTVTVKRDAEVRVHNPIGAPPRQPNDPPPGFNTKFEIVLTFRARVSAVEFDRMTAENAETEKKLDALRDGLRAAQIRHKFDEWLPSTPEQEKLVTAYRKAQKELPAHRLPDLYDDTNSIDAANSLRFPLLFTTEPERRECTEVEAAVRALFKSHTR
jgi:hypothetical protein